MDLAWTAPLHNGGSEISYTVYRLECGAEDKSVRISDTNETTITITELEVGISIDIVTGLQVATEITKFEGFKTVTAFSTVSGNTESVVEVKVAPVQAVLGALDTHIVAERVLNLNELARVNFPTLRDGGIAGGGSDNGPRQIFSRISLHGDADILTHSVIETNVNLSVNRISSTYSVASNFPTIDGRLKPADVSIQREMGIIDYFEEFVVLQTSIKTRN